MDNNEIIEENNRLKLELDERTRQLEELNKRYQNLCNIYNMIVDYATTRPLEVQDDTK